MTVKRYLLLSLSLQFCARFSDDKSIHIILLLYYYITAYGDEGEQN